MKIRQYFILGSLLTILLIALNSCDPKNSITAEDIEIEKINDFMDKRGLSIEPRESGLYFQDETVGTGDFAVAKDTVEVFYTGYFLSGIKFDSNMGGSPIEFVIDNEPYFDVISGWNEGLTLFKEGGSAILIIPSWLAYGSQGNRSIPGNTPLYFEVELVNIRFGPNH